MGSYGIGLGRAMACIVEEHHDEKGIVWPAAVAPYPAQLVALGAGKDPAVGEAADALYQRLADAGVDVLYDDRDESPGVKLTDAELLGMPLHRHHLHPLAGGWRRRGDRPRQRRALGPPDRRGRVAELAGT